MGTEIARRSALGALSAIAALTSGVLKASQEYGSPPASIKRKPNPQNHVKAVAMSDCRKALR